MNLKSQLRRRRRPPSASADVLAPLEQAELNRQGAKAAARGDASSSNPMHEAVNMPDSTGESRATWQQRREAWQLGHDVQSSVSAQDTLPTMTSGARDDLDEQDLPPR